MKNFFLGLAVVAIAFSASAFTNVDQDDYYVKNGLTGKYVLIPAGTFDPEKCQRDADVCAYKVLIKEELPLIATPEELIVLKSEEKVIEIVDPVNHAIILGAYNLTP